MYIDNTVGRRREGDCALLRQGWDGEMNMETGFSGDPAEYVALDEARNRRKRILIIVGVIALVIIALVAWKLTHPTKAPTPTDTSPNVTVIVPGRHEVTARWNGRDARTRTVTLADASEQTVSFDFRTTTIPAKSGR